MNFICDLKGNITVNTTSWVPTATWLFVDRMYSHDILTTIFIEIISDVIRELVVTIWIVTN